MSSSRVPSAGAPPAVSPARVLAGLCLLVPIVVMLWVPSYSKTAPALGGMPFFYWYQLLWVPVSALFTGAAYLLVRRDEAARRAVSAGSVPSVPAQAEGDGK
ncbi:DUF3311 domain-containing protein [Streptomyces sp. TLI_171]|uniref:DUF3311 domain-containing protein n=1 Tax=Streptomyces sp. TLI_171 TaxID=1938859 RepID=UPI000C1A3D62|nr:DUF3311 domain-containing protein [Streptomyces sp. TLI_171]RKE21070.1 uncharacterized protein DUF3311 [Streptomyces sp. TLI_171]